MRCATCPRARAIHSLAADAIGEIASMMRVHPDRIIGTGRTSRVVHARRLVYRFLRDAGLSFPEIGRAVGGKHHTTVMHGISGITACDREILMAVAGRLAMQTKGEAHGPT